MGGTTTAETVWTSSLSQTAGPTGGGGGAGVASGVGGSPGLYGGGGGGGRSTAGVGAQGLIIITYVTNRASTRIYFLGS